MVKADVKHNYYVDLELPPTCSIDDIKKQYRKLALAYHPDRNAGREDEFVPKFQAIQTAHEVLGDPNSKAKYDADRRKAGLYPTARTAPQAGPTGHPYQASSNYPPPPRRTQPGQWQRPGAPAGAGATPTGADRFSNFPRGAPTARKDAAQDRTNMFQAWQNMQNKQQQQQAQQQQFRPPQAAPAGAPPTTQRPRPPPREGTKMPSEDEIRAGMNYRKPPPQYDGGRVDARQSAWASFQKQNAGKPGVGRSNTTRTPKKGFDPNLPGSDERPAQDSSNYYRHRHRSEDHGRQPPGAYPPPPPGPPPPQSPTSPYSPAGTRTFGDPLKPFKSRTVDDANPQVPYAEANRKRTPYTSFIGEKTQFRRESPDGLRRSASTRDTTKLSPDDTRNQRARSTSPLGRHSKTKSHEQNGEHQQHFDDYGDSDVLDDGPMSESPQEFESNSTTPAETPGRPGTAPQATSPFERPKARPTPPSRRFNGSTNPFSPPPPQSAGADGAQSDADAPGMQQKTANNMYVNNFDPFTHDAFNHSPFEPGMWAANWFGTSTHPTCEAQQQFERPDTTTEASSSGARHRRNIVMPTFPDWATPPSVRYGSKIKTPTAVDINAQFAEALGNPLPTTSTPIESINSARANERFNAFCFVRGQLERSYGEVPEGFDVDVFLKLASTASRGESCGHNNLDGILARMLEYFPSAFDVSPLARIRGSFADRRSRVDSFTFPFNQDMFGSQKSRSEEQINTKFSPEGWDGKFTGSPDYLAPSSQPSGRKASSPASRMRSGLRSTTSQEPPASSGSATGAETEANAQGATPNGVKFSKEEWERTFQEPSWVWPPPPPNPPSPTKKATRGGRKPSRSAASGSRQQPSVVEGDDSAQADGGDGTAHSAAAGDEGDAMDIDSTPPSRRTTDATQENTQTQNEAAKEPRLYAVPPSAWRQSQQAQAQVNGHHRKASSRTSATTPLKTNLDDLAHVEPMTQSANGLKNLNDLNATLPFQSQASATLPMHPLEPQKLQMPALPKAPEPPMKLTVQSWHAFASAFGAYLQAYHAFNNTMLQHFAARERKAQAQLAAGTTWLEAAGDTTRGSGFGGYLRGVKEDEEVREAWNLGCERHLEAVKAFEKMRERVRKMAGSGGLAEY